MLLVNDTMNWEHDRKNGQVMMIIFKKQTPVVKDWNNPLPDLSNGREILSISFIYEKNESSKAK